MITTIVFDFGNVVGFFDYRRTTGPLSRHSPMSEEELQQFLYCGDLEETYEAGRISSQEFLRQVHAGCRLTCSNEDLIRIYSDMFAPNEEVCRLVPLLRPRYKLLLGSNTNELHSQHFRRQFAETLQHLDSLVLSHEVGARKPDRAFFEAAQSRAGVSASECLFIDDLPVNVAGAKACGWQGIVYRRGEDLRPILRDYGVYL